MTSFFPCLRSHRTGDLGMIPEQFTESSPVQNNDASPKIQKESTDVITNGLNKNELSNNYDSIKKLAKKINRIKDKSILIAIINIIRTMNPDVSITENENGMFIKFNTLTPQTYIKLENYFMDKMLDILLYPLIF